MSHCSCSSTIRLLLLCLVEFVAVLRSCCFTAMRLNLLHDSFLECLVVLCVNNGAGLVAVASGQQFSL